LLETRVIDGFWFGQAALRGLACEVNHFGTGSRRAALTRMFEGLDVAVDDGL